MSDGSIKKGRREPTAGQIATVAGVATAATAAAVVATNPDLRARVSDAFKNFQQRRAGDGFNPAAPGEGTPAGAAETAGRAGQPLALESSKEHPAQTPAARSRRQGGGGASGGQGFETGGEAGAGKQGGSSLGFELGEQGAQGEPRGRSSGGAPITAVEPGLSVDSAASGGALKGKLNAAPGEVLPGITGAGGVDHAAPGQALKGRVNAAPGEALHGAAGAGAAVDAASGAGLNGAALNGAAGAVNGAALNGAAGAADGAALNGAALNGAGGAVDGAALNGVAGAVDGAALNGAAGAVDGAALNGADALAGEAAALNGAGEALAGAGDALAADGLLGAHEPGASVIEGTAHQPQGRLFDLPGGGGVDPMMQPWLGGPGEQGVLFGEPPRPAMDLSGQDPLFELDALRPSTELSGQDPLFELNGLRSAQEPNLYDGIIEATRPGEQGALFAMPEGQPRPVEFPYAAPGEQGALFHVDEPVRPWQIPGQEALFDLRELTPQAVGEPGPTLFDLHADDTRWSRLPWRDAPLAANGTEEIRAVMRPYQRAVHARLTLPRPSDGVLGRAQVANLPTGTGKTLIGVAYAQEALARAQGRETVVFVAPSTVVAQQWRAALVYDSKGPKLPSSRVFSGTPSELAKLVERFPGQPKPGAVVLTASGLERLNREGELEGFLSALRARTVVLDEVHKMVSDPKGPQSKVVEKLVNYAKQGALSGVLGLSATTDGVSENIERLGFESAVRIPPEAMIPSGFVPAYDAHGVISTLSSEESAVQKLLGELRNDSGKLLGLLDTEAVQARFKELAKTQGPELKDVFRHELAKYGSRSPGAQAREIDTRIGKLLASDMKLSRNQADLVLAIQSFDGLSDAALVEKYGKPGAKETFAALSKDIAERRAALGELVRLPEYAKLFEGTFGEAPVRVGATAEAAVRSKNLGQTLLGLVESTRSYWRTFGAGLSETALTLHSQERAARAGVASKEPLGTLIFARSESVPARLGASGPARFGPASVPGLMVEGNLLKGKQQTAIGLQTIHAFLPEEKGLRARILDKVLFPEILQKEVGGALVDELLADLPWKDAAQREAFEPALRQRVEAAVGRHLTHIQKGGTRRGPRALLGRMGTAAANANAPAPVAKELAARIKSPEASGLQGPLRDLTEWLRVARRIEQASLMVAQSRGGSELPISVVNMGSGRSRQLMRTLFTRAMDAGSKVGIDAAALSDGWAEGTDFLRPSVVVMSKRVDGEGSFRQRLGRGLRASPDWKPWHSELLGKLVGTPGMDPASLGDLPDAQRQEIAAMDPPIKPLDVGNFTPDEQAALREAVAGSKDEKLISLVEKGTFRNLTQEQRFALASRLLAYQNKVVRAYEVYEYKEGGASPDLTVDKDVLRRTAANEVKYERLPLPSASSAEIATGPRQAEILNPSTRTTPRELAERVNALPRAPEVATAWLKSAFRRVIA